MRITVLVVLFSLPFAVLAAPGDFFGPIVPSCAYTSGEICRACDLKTTAFNLLKVLATLAVIAAAIMFTWSGILFATASAFGSNLDRARKLFFSVLLGLVFVLAAALIIDLVLRATTPYSLIELTDVRCVPY